MRGFFFIVLCSISACSSGTVAETSTAQQGVTREKPDPPLQEERKHAPLMTVSDPGVMHELEASGMRLETLVPKGKLEPVWRSIENEVASVARDDKHAGVGIRGNSHRLFDVRWLRAKDTRFELVAIMHRPDRRPFHQNACGETRVVYRLAYSVKRPAGDLYSRLPMTLNLEYRADDERDGSCNQAVQRWQLDAGTTPAKLADVLRGNDGPLSADRLSPGHLSQLVFNVQTVRWPSTVRPDMAGHAEYLMRAFRWDATARALEPKPLENTPNIKALRKDKALRDKLRSWLLAHAADIDQGTADLPDEFLAQESKSVTAHGLNRLSNRPFSQVFDAAEFSGLNFDGHRYTRSTVAFMRRLDEMTCAGCHQSRSLAGFHALGEEPAHAAAGNRLDAPFSAHVYEDLHRRTQVALDVVGDKRADYARHLAERNPAETGRYGAHCGLGDLGFKDWTCASGLRCVPFVNAKDDHGVGVCMPDKPQVGDACEVGSMRPSSDAKRDRVIDLRRTACAPDAVCNNNRVGFPGGMCTSTCGSGAPNGRCGGIALLTPFNNCLAEKRPFSACLANHVAPAGLRACSRDEPCRDDYVCAHTPNGGACIPPYFVFQLRVDGHQL